MNAPRRLLLSGAAVTLLVALVAAASRAHRPGGGHAQRGGTPTLLLEYLGSMGLIVVLVGGVVIVWAATNERRRKALAGPTNWRRTLAGLALAALTLFLAVSATRHLTRPASHARRPITAPLHAANAQRAKLHPRPATQRNGGWLAALVLTSVLIGVSLAVAVAIRQRRRHREEIDEEVALARALDEVLADTLDDLREERDPRKAVIRAYARMERTFAAYRVPRDPAATPLEYVASVLDRLDVSALAVRRLTALFERAKFSTHPVDTGMKDDAIETLAALRGELETGEEVAA